MERTPYGQPPFPQLRYCVRCCMPETAEGMEFDEMGICRACRSQEQKMHIDWSAREKELRRILDHYRQRAGDNYDCIVPISGGKDSIFQLHVITREYGMKPLACTFSHNWWSDTGRYNLQNTLEKMGVDHVMFTPSRSLVNRLAKRSVYLIGDACWHCHRGVDAFPLQVAVMYKVPLIIWGESAAEGVSGKAMYNEPHAFDMAYIDKWSTKARIDEMTDDAISVKDLRPFRIPSLEELEKVGVVRIFLSDYVFWDAERYVEMVKERYGWREDDVEGTYKKYKSVECIMPGVHDYAKFIKRGYGRATDHACLDVRAGLLKREDGFELIKDIDPKRPEILDYFLEITGMSEEEFLTVLKAQRKENAKGLA